MSSRVYLRSLFIWPVVLIACCFSSKNNLMCHSHDDLGWLYTIDEYYQISVREIFKTTLDALEKTSLNEPRLKRKFVYSEIGFLKMFIYEDPKKADMVIQRIKLLIQNGQWDWVNGGISMADEACTHFEDIISNFYAGQKFLKVHFNSTSQVAWQLDPFGHSKGMLFLARKFGMKHAFLCRLTNELFLDWQKNRNLEFVWRFPDGSEIVSHVYSHYNSAASLFCDMDCQVDKFNQTQFDKDCNSQNTNYKFNNAFLVGDDFNFSKAESRFEFLDFVISKNGNSGYATALDYTNDFDANSQKNDLMVFEDDMFVFKEGSLAAPDAWSGYFTTKPRLKYKIRRIGKILRVFKTFVTAIWFLLSVEIREQKWKEMDQLNEEMGVFLHHDCITGTAKVKVDEDYFKRIRKLEKDISEFKLLSSDWLVFGTRRDSGYSQEMFCDFNDLKTGVQTQCNYFGALSNGRMVTAFIIHSPNFQQDKLFTIIIPELPSNFLLSLETFGTRKTIPASINCFLKKKMCWVYFKLKFEVSLTSTILLIPTKIENNKIKVDLLEISKVTNSSYAIFLKNETNNSETFKIEKKDVIIIFETFEIVAKKNSVTYISKIHENFENVITFKYIKSGESGHYLLKYQGENQQHDYNEFISITKFSNQFFNSVILNGTKVDLMIKQETNCPYYIIESLIKNHEGFREGIDVVLIIQNPNIINSESEFFTDSNGLFKIKRKAGLSFEASVYPVTTYAQVNDDSAKCGIVVFNDRAQGAFLTNNSLGFYVQRSASVQDHKGNDEILSVNEDVLTEHFIYNFNGPEPDEHDFLLLRNLQDVEPLLYVIPDPEYLEIIERIEFGLFGIDSLVSNPSLRFNCEIVDSKSVLVKVQNLSEKIKVKIDLKNFLEERIKNARFMEVDFGYVYGNDYQSSALQNIYEIDPLCFVTLIAHANEKINEENLFDV